MHCEDVIMLRVVNVQVQPSDGCWRRLPTMAFSRSPTSRRALRANRVTVNIETPGRFVDVGKGIVEVLHERFGHVAFLAGSGHSVAPRPTRLTYR